MKIDGKHIAQEIFDNLQKEVQKLKEVGVVPHVAIILVGDDPASASYVRQKVLKTEAIGGKATVVHLPTDISEAQLLKTVEKYNKDPLVHGVIVQRPLPPQINSEQVNQRVDAKKDIDAFRQDSPYQMPLAAAVLTIIEHALYLNKVAKADQLRWLQEHSIVVIGKGETGGGPTIELFKELGIEPKIIDSKTTNPQEVIQNADVVISTVGKHEVVKKENLKQGVILIGVGMHRGVDGKLHADYMEEEIQNIASYFTPVPGGVGPVNVAMLLKNLVLAAE